MTPGLGCDPEDGDLVQSPPPVEVPDDVPEAGLLDTHNRVARAWRGYAAGYTDGWPQMTIAGCVLDSSQGLGHQETLPIGTDDRAIEQTSRTDDWGLAATKHKP